MPLSRPVNHEDRSRSWFWKEVFPEASLSGSRKGRALASPGAWQVPRFPLPCSNPLGCLCPRVSHPQLCSRGFRRSPLPGAGRPRALSTAAHLHPATCPVSSWACRPGRAGFACHAPPPQGEGSEERDCCCFVHCFIPRPRRTCGMNEGGREGPHLLQSPTPFLSCQVWRTVLRPGASPRQRGKGGCASDSGGLGRGGAVRALGVVPRVQDQLLCEGLSQRSVWHRGPGHGRDCWSRSLGGQAGAPCTWWTRASSADCCSARSVGNSGCHKSLSGEGAPAPVCTSPSGWRGRALPA